MHTITEGIFLKLVGWEVKNFVPELGPPPKEIKVEITPLDHLLQRNSIASNIRGEQLFRAYYAITENSILRPLRPFDSMECFANQRIHSVGWSLMIEWKDRLQKIKFVVGYVSKYEEGEQDEVYIILHLVTDDAHEWVGKIRRRIEQKLRMADPAEILTAAELLNANFSRPACKEKK